MSKLIVDTKGGKLPISVRIIIVMLAISGVLGIVGILAAAAAGNLHVDLGVLNLWAASGLSRRSAGWRKFVLVELCIAMGICLIFLPVFAFGPQPELRVLGKTVRELPRGTAMLFAIAMGLVSLWVFRVLLRPSVRAMFFSHRPVPLGALLELSAAQLVGRLEQLQARDKHDAVESQIGQVDDAIADLQDLRGRMAGPAGGEMLTENLRRIDYVLNRAIRVRDSHRAADGSLASES